MEPAQALATAERLLDQRLPCPLGGTFKLDPKTQSWMSSAWTEPSLDLVNHVPAKYHPASLEWLRGGGLEFTMGPDFLQTHLELVLDPSKKP